MNFPGQTAFETLYRKLTRSFGQRGVLSTVRRCIAVPARIVGSSIRDLSPRQRQYRAEECEFDRRHNVDTRVRKDPGWLAGIDSPNWVHGIGYQPVPTDDIVQIIAGLDIEFEQFVFLDLGAGKGRALLVAAQFPFKRIVGVEYSPNLAKVLQGNIASYTNDAQRCFELEGRLQDATEFELPLEPLVLFFHHPFDEPVFRQVVARIEDSLSQCARTILAIYYDPHCGNVFDESPYFQVRTRGYSRGRFAASSDWVVYGSRVPSEVGTV
jgi:SAM-dependent methyltransferase